MPEFQIRMGALADSIKDQLKEFGLVIEKPEQYQKQADAISLLNVTGLIPDGVAHKARERLMKKITAGVKEQ